MPFNYDQLKTRQRAEQEAEVNGIENLSHKILWEQFPNSIPLLIGNRYVYQLVPVIIHLMMEGSHRVWGDACYPVVE